MTRWKRAGGWPLAVASLSLAAGVLFGVQTVQIQEVPVVPPTTEPTQTITTDEFVAQVARQVAHRLRVRGVEITPEEVVELLDGDGDGVIVTTPEAPTAPAPTTTRPPRSATTTTTTTTTMPPRTTIIPRDGSLLDDLRDEFVPAPTTVP